MTDRFRAEVVGSLLRPPALRDAVDRFYGEGHHAVLPEERAADRSELERIEDEAIRDVVQRQVDLGLDVVTDGEFRRWMFLNSFSGTPSRASAPTATRSSSGPTTVRSLRGTSSASRTGCARSTARRPGRLLSWPI